MNAALVILLLLCAKDISSVTGQTNTGGNTRRRSQSVQQKTVNRSVVLSTNATQSNCTFGFFACDNGNCVAQDDVCDGVNSCGDSSDERRCRNRSKECWLWQEFCIDGGCRNGTFQCTNGKCINTSDVCDKVNHCGDGSDELRAVSGFKCPLGLGGDICVLPQRHIKDNFTNCNNDADESETSDKQRKVFRCFDKSMEISNLQQCDGVVDCPDMSDECPCEVRNDAICGRFCTDESGWGQSNCTQDTFVCLSGSEISRSKVCDGMIDCSEGIDEQYCRLNTTGNLTKCAGDIHNTTQILARLCDGRPECFDLSDECILQCTGPLPGYCSLNISSKTPPVHQCSTNSGTFNLTAEHICNGLWSACSPRIPEEEMNCTGRFYCRGGSPLSIDISLTCDGFADCEDQSDEKECSFRYKCDSGVPLSVPMRFVLDGVKDCKGGSDECPRYLDDEPIRSRTSLISLPFFQVWIWIAGICCLLGNGYIITSKARRLKEIQKSEGLSKCNHFLVTNLSVADSIMGIYLLGISSKQVMVSGNYCLHDLTWRTSKTCFWLGAFTIISSETSVFMLILLTTLRLMSVHNPLKARNIKFKWAALAATIAWTTSLLLAFLPNSDLAAQMFRYGAFIRSKFMTTTSVTLTDARKFATILSDFSPNSSTVTMGEYWSDIASYLRANHPAHKITHFYGYYSEYGVCMPDFYSLPTERTWGFSFGIITLNFLIFIYIAVAYVLIYKKATYKSVKSTVDRSAVMQRKIIRLVVTNFCCWMPICLIAFLHSGGVIDATGQVYALTAIVLLPINSVLNPFLYSNLFDIIWEKIKPVYQILKSSGLNETTNLPQVPMQMMDRS